MRSAHVRCFPENGRKKRFSFLFRTDDGAGDINGRRLIYRGFFFFAFRARKKNRGAKNRSESSRKNKNCGGAVSPGFLGVSVIHIFKTIYIKRNREREKEKCAGVQK